MCRQAAKWHLDANHLPLRLTLAVDALPKTKPHELGVCKVTSPIALLLVFVMVYLFIINRQDPTLRLVVILCDCGSSIAHRHFFSLRLNACNQIVPLILHPKSDSIHYYRSRLTYTEYPTDPSSRIGTICKSRVS